MASQSLIQISELLENYTIEFEKPVPDRLKCIICLYILKNAKQTSCGCKVCEVCIAKYLKDDERPCPSKQPDCADSQLRLNRDVQQDNATNREISNLRAKCPFTGCDKMDSVKMLLTHISDCEYRDVKCDKCSKKYPWKNRSTHEDNECDQRIRVCDHCQERMTDLKLRTIHLNEDHEDLCSKYIVDCNNGCGLEKVVLKEHLKICTNKKIDCPFSSMKCSEGKLTVKKLAEHLQERAYDHFNDLVKVLNDIKSNNKTLMEDVDRHKNLLKEQMEITKKLTDSQQKLVKQIDDIKKKGIPGVSSQQERNVIFRNGTYIWKIVNFESLQHEAETAVRSAVTSDPFYTSEFGYKMCLRIYPSGDGVGRNTHLSVFFAIMKGEYDDLLSWPFRQKVTLSLIDQENYGAKNHSDTFKPDARSACYQKPVDDCNIASGSPKFIPLSSVSPNTMFCKNDTIYLKIVVDAVGISRP